MSKCAISGKSPVRGVKYVRRGLAKAKGGVGVKIVGKTKRWFRPNLQKIKIIDENGTVRRQWVTVKAIRSGLITKAPKQKIAREIAAELAAARKKKK